MMSDMLYWIVDIGFALAISPLLSTVIKKVKAATQGRSGPPLMQGYRNLLKLLKKERVYSSNASYILRLTPILNMAAITVACLSIPLIFLPSQTLGFGNVIFFLYLLALGRFFMALAGLDVGSTFGGMGSSREMTLSSVVEPITVVVFAALTFTFKTFNIHGMIAESVLPWHFLDPAYILIALPLFIVLIAETSRIPVDNPETHLELTMVHEAMLLEYSGEDLALMEFSAQVKQTLLMGVMINILLPWGIALDSSISSAVFGMLAFLIKALALSFFIGVFESSIAKMRLFNLPNMFMVAYFLSIITILLEVFT